MPNNFWNHEPCPDQTLVPASYINTRLRGIERAFDKVELVLVGASNVSPAGDSGAIPEGGATGQVLVKNSSDSSDVSWSSLEDLTGWLDNQLI